MRYFLTIISCLMVLALIGPGAARATELAGCGDSPTAMRTASAKATDCDMGQNQKHKCDQDAGCGYYLVVISEVRDLSTPPVPRTAAVASVVKHLTSSGRETLLDPPRA